MIIKEPYDGNIKKPAFAIKQENISNNSSVFQKDCASVCGNREAQLVQNSYRMNNKSAAEK